MYNFSKIGDISLCCGWVRIGDRRAIMWVSLIVTKFAIMQAHNSLFNPSSCSNLTVLSTTGTGVALPHFNPRVMLEHLFAMRPPLILSFGSCHMGRSAPQAVMSAFVRRIMARRRRREFQLQTRRVIIKIKYACSICTSCLHKTTVATCEPWSTRPTYLKWEIRQMCDSITRFMVWRI